MPDTALVLYRTVSKRPCLTFDLTTALSGMVFFHLSNSVISVYISTPTWFPSRHLPSCPQSEWVPLIPTAYWCLHCSTCSSRFTFRFNLWIHSLVFLLTHHHAYHDAYWKMASLATSSGRYPFEPPVSFTAINSQPFWFFYSYSCLATILACSQVLSLLSQGYHLRILLYFVVGFETFSLFSLKILLCAISHCDSCSCHCSLKSIFFLKDFLKFIFVF